MRKRICQRSDDQRSRAQECASRHLLVAPCGLVVGPDQMALLHGTRAAVQDLWAQETANRQ